MSVQCLILMTAGFIAVQTAGAVATRAAMPDAEGVAFFEKRVRPVLIARCLSCHGPQKQESDLRVDSLDALLKGGARGPSISKENPAASLLVEAISRQGELQMPPDRALEPAEAAAIRDWIKIGAPWPTHTATGRDTPLSAGHWAFQPVTKPQPPSVLDSSWGQTPVDQFILSRVEAAGLAPAPQASRRDLIRRVTFDLWGLPPTPEEVAEFENDTSPNAFANLVERLLASPRYGERWGRHWLDLARYADNKGYVFFEDANYPWAYTYRDYVIRAYNEDLPYDRFVLEQIAADQLELGDDRSALTALGFLTVGGHFMNNTHDIIDDRIDVVTRGLLGLTVSCARCHDHKYDPVPIDDYYALYGVFRSSYEPMVPPLFRAPPDTEEYRTFEKTLAEREQKLRDFVLSKHATLVREARTRVDEYLMAAYQRRNQPAADDFMLLSDTNDINPTMITRWERYLESTSTVQHPVWQPWHVLSKLSDAEFAASATQQLQSMIAGEQGGTVLNSRVVAALSNPPLESVSDLAKRYGELFRKIDADKQAGLETATSAPGNAVDESREPATDELRQVLYGRGMPPDVPIELDWGFLSLFPDRPTQDEYKKLLKAVEEGSTQGAAAPPRAMVLLDSEQPSDTRVFLRGNPNRLGAEVPRRFLSILDPAAEPFHRGSGRLELAQRIVAADNPLTARVFVNRLWQQHFGQGLVATPSDFGLRSESPTHPELLDYLATEFVRSGWSIKHMHRMILHSATYQQSVTPANSSRALQVDPENRLLSHMNRRRLDFEATRDALLAYAGRLDLRIGGPAVDLIGQLNPRRTIYGFINRMDVPPLLTTFDFPNPAATSPGRDETTVSPQALYFLNHEHVAALAENLIQRTDVAPLDVDAKIDRLYQILFSRAADENERQAGKAFVGDASTGAVWTTYAHALFMTNEMVFVD